MNHFEKRLAAIAAPALLIGSMIAGTAYAEECRLINLDNHWRDSDFRPYNETKDWGDNHVSNQEVDAKVLVFFSRNCVESVEAVSAMGGSPYMDSSNVEIAFIDTISSRKSDIDAMIQNYDLSAVSDQIYYSPTSYPNQTAYWDYMNYSELNLSRDSNGLPATIILDTNDKIRYARSGGFSIDEADCVLKTLLEGEDSSVPGDTAGNTESLKPSDKVTLYFMTGSSPDVPGEVFAEFEVPRHSRGNTTTLGNTVNTLADNVPQKDGATFLYWQEQNLSNASALGNRVNGVIWTEDSDQYIYAQYQVHEKDDNAENEKETGSSITLYYMTGSSPDSPGEVFAEFEVPKNARKNTVTLGNTINTLPDKTPKKEGSIFQYWQEQSLSDSSKLGNRIYGTIWTGELDQYIYAQYR